jgi:hypothetical protein
MIVATGPFTADYSSRSRIKSRTGYQFRHYRGEPKQFIRAFFNNNVVRPIIKLNHLTRMKELRVLAKLPQA